MNARILWTFFQAFRVYGEEVYRQTAHRAYAYIAQHFWDTEFKGVFWLVDYLGRPVESKRSTNGNARTITAGCALKLWLGWIA